MVDYMNEKAKLSFVRSRKQRYKLKHKEKQRTLFRTWHIYSDNLPTLVLRF